MRSVSESQKKWVRNKIEKESTAPAPVNKLISRHNVFIGFRPNSCRDNKFLAKKPAPANSTTLSTKRIFRGSALKHCKLFVLSSSRKQNKRREELIESVAVFISTEKKQVEITKLARQFKSRTDENNKTESRFNSALCEASKVSLRFRFLRSLLLLPLHTRSANKVFFAFSSNQLSFGR